MLVAGPPTDEAANCAFYLHSVDTLNDSDRCFLLTPEDFARMNPNTGTAPIFRTRRDADLTKRIYDRLPVLVDRSSGEDDPDDVDYIYSTFPIVERQEIRDHWRFLTRDLAKHWINALQAGRPDAEIKA